MDVFSAFPEGIVFGRYEIGVVAYGTEVGTVFSEAQTIDVIVEDETNVDFNKAPSANAEYTGMLMYVQPAQAPSTNPNVLTNGYMIHDTETDYYYEITEVGVGKNQENGEIEHLELKLRQTEVAVAGEDDGDE